MDSQPAPSLKEDHISQVPALQLLMQLGWQYLTPEEAREKRGGKTGNVLLEAIVAEQLRKINRINYRGEEYPFEEGNIIQAIEALKSFPFDGLIRTNERIYDLLCLGKSLQQSINGDVKSFTLKYIDWENPERNAFHIADEYTVDRTASNEAYRPDIVLFINGIPVGVIECKGLSTSPTETLVDQAVSQMIRNQKDDGIPKLFLYSQLLLAVAKNEAKYATTGTAAKFWAVWKEKPANDKAVEKAINKPLPKAQKEKLLSGRYSYTRDHFEGLEQNGRQVTEQDRTIHALCRPERLLELTYRFLIYDAGEKKVARYQQYFCVNKILDRVKEFDNEGHRKGGVVWHTQGSGKSLTMVMLAKAIALQPEFIDHKIVLVTDRVDLDEQISRTFHHCGREVSQAKSGKDLMELICGEKSQIISTVIDKFDVASSYKEFKNESVNVFVLVDESHRTQYGAIHAKMRKALPNACYLGFTGTPLMKKEKNTVSRFGGLIDTYTITEAVKDKAVVPLLYEGRHVEQRVDGGAIDEWFERITRNLTKQQIVELKKRFATGGHLNKTEQKIKRVAYDISEHFSSSFKGTLAKAQLVTPSKLVALRYKDYLDEFGVVSSEVLISGPDEREGEEEISGDSRDAILNFWKKMMVRFGTEKEYNRQLINSFKTGDSPEIIIVVDKLLTGFDAPRNTVLYLCRSLKEHTLLQAIARVNRLFEGKEFGFIVDYYGILSNLDEALDLYGNLEDFDVNDLKDAMIDVSSEVSNLPQKHSDLWDVFKGVMNKQDEEEFERYLADESLRPKFYDRLSAYSRCLAIALATVKFIEETPAQKIERYRSDLKFFMTLRANVRRRYSESLDFREYERKIQKLLDTHVGTGAVEKVTELVNIFDKDRFAEEVAKIEGKASKADTIASRTQRTITERMSEDPAFYKRFSDMLNEIIALWRQKRLSDSEYLSKVTEVMHAIQNRTGDKLPKELQDRPVAKAFFGSIRDFFKSKPNGDEITQKVGSQIALGIDDIILNRKIVSWETNTDVQNQMKTAIEDFLFELKDEEGFDLSFEEIDKILEQCLDIARERYKS